MSNTDPEIIQWTTRALDVLGFDYVLEPSNRANGLVVVRLRGGLREVMRFFHTTDPAITRKRSIEGVAIKSDAKLRVAAIEPLGIELPMYDITTGTGDFIANGVVSHNCFARNTHTYLDLDAGRDFDSKVIVKVNAPELLRKKLASPGWAGEHIAMGTNVDCYQRAEGRYQLMRGIIAALRDAANPFSILTKGTLILRDLDLLLEAAEVTDVGLNVSAAFVDTVAMAGHRAGHAGAGAAARGLRHAQRRRAALRRADGAGRAVPVRLPRPARRGGPADRRGGRGARHADRAAPAAGRPRVVPRLAARRRTRSWSPRYAELYGRGAYARKDYQARIAAQVRELAEQYGVGRGNPRQARAVRSRAATAPPRPLPRPRSRGPSSSPCCSGARGGLRPHLAVISG